LSVDSETDALDRHLLPLDAGLDHLTAVTLTPASVEAFCSGQSAAFNQPRMAPVSDPDSAPFRVYDTDNRLIGLGSLAPGGLGVAPTRVIQW